MEWGEMWWGGVGCFMKILSAFNPSPPFHSSSGAQRMHLSKRTKWLNEPRSKIKKMAPEGRVFLKTNTIALSISQILKINEVEHKHLKKTIVAWIF